MRTLAFAMQKGGVGKTTTVLNVGVALARRGARVLLVDLDPQANLTEGLGVDPEAAECSVYEVLLNPDRGVGLAAVPTAHGVDLAPSRLALAGAELELAGKFGRELLLREALAGSNGRYDYALIDPPPSLGIFTANALVAAEAVIVPLQLHAYALKAMDQLEATVGLLRKLNPGLRVGGIVCTLGSSRTTLGRGVEEEARRRYGELVFETVIPYNITLAEAPAAGEPIAAYAPKSVGARAYECLTAEVEARYGRA